MDNLLTVAFEAHHAEKNHHRRYQMTVGRDLLNNWTVAILYGRVGQGGQERRYASANPDDVRAVIRDRPAAACPPRNGSGVLIVCPPSTSPRDLTLRPGCRARSWPSSLERGKHCATYL